MQIKFLSLLLVISFFGCAGSPARIAMMSEEDLKEEKTLTLCAAYGNKLFRKEKVKSELMARSVLHKQEFRNIFKLPDKGKISEDHVEPKNNGADRIELMKKWGLKESPPETWEWDLIERGSIRVGMTKCGLLASWGRPKRIHRSSHGSDQWVYGDYSYNNTYVYIRAGKIKSWQD